MATKKIGPGFYIGHGIGIVINKGTSIRKACNISQFCNIGTSKKTPATIGDYVYIGPNVSNVVIGSYATIGAGTVVIKGVPEYCTSVGNPNRILPA